MPTGGLGPTDADEDFSSKAKAKTFAQNQESDLERAFHLQLQEAVSVSLASQPSTSSTSIPVQEQEEQPPGTQSDGGDNFPTLQVEELAKLVQEFRDGKQSAIEACRINEDLVGRIEEERFASKILCIYEHDWREWGDNFERPSDAGCSSSNGVGENSEYFGHTMALKETCGICLEDTDTDKMFSVDACLHRYCYSCTKQHVKVKLLHRMLPKCPHEGCNSNITVDSCLKFLTPKYMETMRELTKEASIPVAEKVYCPHPKCSALMSKTEVFQYTMKTLFATTSTAGQARKCLNCHGLFCIICNVPWHRGMLCHEYERLNPNLLAEEVKLKSLAIRNLWRQCKNCGHMIELAEGCYHMTCRCGSEFCYNCGAERMNQTATCSCAIWDEANILQEDEPEDDDFADPRLDFFRRN